MDAEGPGEITRLLEELYSAGEGARQATEKLSALLYTELSRIASAYLRHEHPARGIQTQSLVHEAYIRLAERTPIRWQNRAHFLGVAARVMRQILVDHARRRNAAKRGGDWQRVTIDSGLLGKEGAFELELLALDQALKKLREQDKRSAQVAELRIFAGMKNRDIAEVLGVSPRTVDNDWVFAHLWLSRELNPNDASPGPGPSN